ncbi:hypothetical protein GCM10010988_21470 [Cnuibacter physcomitrellae]|uniref:Uncharacterized protein n=2 Tax=Cnuibacter physcomitrellae TaxID=1619308 RepID=A0A1X9LNP1_9MICO|nr:hypothetical protein B5808_17545 [Cnuibacter physcomitrellae]GGI38918.1 hypothetical protein GCM10010988_21470 [Cnuibacter physcomitrellae]
MCADVNVHMRQRRPRVDQHPGYRGVHPAPASMTLMQRGLHLRLTPAEAARVLVTAGDDPALRAALAALEEDVAASGRAGEIDKAWDPIACALAPEGPAADWPARGVIGGARSLQHDADASWVTHSSPAEVRDVAAFLAALTDPAFRTA